MMPSDAPVADAPVVDPITAEINATTAKLAAETVSGPPDDLAPSAAPVVETPVATESAAPAPASSDQDTQFLDPKPAGPPADETLLADVHMSDDYRNNTAVKESKTVSDLVKRMISSQEMIGKEKLVVPGKDATPQDWDAVYDKLGRPETPANYDLKTMPDLPEGLIPSDLMDSYGRMAHEQGLSTKQTNEIFSFYQRLLIEGADNNEEVRLKSNEESTLELQQEYGNAFEQKVRVANSVFRNTRGGLEALAEIKGKGLENSPAVVKWLVGMGEGMGEDRLMGLDGGSAGLGHKTPAAAKARYAELTRHPAYANQYHPENAVIMKEIADILPDVFPDP